MNLQDAIVAAQAAKKTLFGADSDVSNERQDVADKQAVLATAQAGLQAAIDAETADKAAYKGTLSDLAAAVQSEIDAL